MDAATRRARIAQYLSTAEGPVSAASLASRLGVSRQVIVGDVALLRAGGERIYATPRGYETRRESAGLRRVVACRHGLEETERELLALVDNGCAVMDVIVEHPIYGELTGELHILNRRDVDEFCRRLMEDGAAPLSTITGGTHLHNLLCDDEEGYQRAREQLDKLGVLLK